jgi:hypothetical protein
MSSSVLLPYHELRIGIFIERIWFFRRLNSRKYRFFAFGSSEQFDTLSEGWKFPEILQKLAPNIIFTYMFWFWISQNWLDWDADQLSLKVGTGCNQSIRITDTDLNITSTRVHILIVTSIPSQSDNCGKLRSFIFTKFYLGYLVV